MLKAVSLLSCHVGGYGRMERFERKFGRKKEGTKQSD